MKENSIREAESIMPVAKDYKSVLGKSGISGRGNTVCICTCVHCRAGTVARLIKDDKMEFTFR